MYPQIVVDFLNYSAIAISAIGILIMLHACIVTLASIIKIELARKKTFRAYENRKRVFIQRIILSLDFFVAADLLRLVLVTSMEEILFLSVIVGIRTILNWSLSKEIHLHEE
ncbi:MAG: DUF1622 domain-containing protein [Candidatus Micrarchaeota archaeon]